MHKASSTPHSSGARSVFRGSWILLQSRRLASLCLEVCSGRCLDAQRESERSRTRLACWCARERYPATCSRRQLAASPHLFRSSTSTRGLGEGSRSSQLSTDEALSSRNASNCACDAASDSEALPQQCSAQSMQGSSWRASPTPPRYLPGT